MRQIELAGFGALCASDDSDELFRSHARRPRDAGTGYGFSIFPNPRPTGSDSQARLSKVLEKIDKELTSGTNVVLHCRQGIGRSGLVAACLLVAKGVEVKAAIKRLSAARDVQIPETDEQRRWIDHFASNFVRN